MKTPKKLSLVLGLCLGSIIILFIIGAINVRFSAYVSFCENKNDLSEDEIETMNKEGGTLVDQIINKNSKVIFDRFLDFAKEQSPPEKLDESFKKTQELFGRIISKPETLHIFKIYSKPEIQVLCQEKIDNKIVDYKIGPLMGFNRYTVVVQKARTDMENDIIVETYFVNEQDSWRIYAFYIKPFPTPTIEIDS